MKKEIKDRWVEALRSGDYQQGERALKEGENFCCLGVLCDLHAKEVGGSWADSRVENHQRYLGLLGFLPGEVKFWAGTRRSTSNELVRLNDKLNYTFEQIADWIEENWERL